MKKLARVTFLSLAAAWAALAAPASAAQGSMAGTIGVGLIGGSPTGVTGKWFYDDKLALDGGIGYGNAAVFYADALYNWWGLGHQPSDGKVVAYAGGGPRIATDDAGQVGLRTVAGVGYWPNAYPVELFAEVGPVWKLSPNDGRVNWDGGVGFRAYFNVAVSRASKAP